MAAPRSTSLRALRILSQQHSPAPSSVLRRSLHMTGVYSAQPASGPDVTSIYRSRSVADLKAECEKRNIRTGGSKAELVDRLANHDFLQTRAFSIAMKRIDGPAFGQSSDKGRQFNTSRANKAVNDSSPVDFVFMPTNNAETGSNMAPGFPRMPTPPDYYTHYELVNTSGTLPMKPEIYSVGGAPLDANGPSPMAEVVDNYSVDINPYNLTEIVTRSKRAAASLDVARSQEGEVTIAGMAKGLWNMMIEDHPKKNSDTTLK